jgi:hypothetical protein
MREPKWASELYAQVCKDEGRSLKKAPKLNWGYSQLRWRVGSSGHYSPWEHHIRVVTKKVIAYDIEQKQVFLHEICHWLTQPRNWRTGKKRAWHGKRFYTKLNLLLTKYDAKTDSWKEREGHYMKRSVNYL